MVIWEKTHDQLRQDRKQYYHSDSADNPLVGESQNVIVPKNYIQQPVPEDVYRNYRGGLTGATVDLIICTRVPHHHDFGGKVAILAMMRKPGNAYNGQWFMPGGSLPTYEPIEDFLKRKIKEECNLEIPHIETLMGIYRCCAEDRPDSSMTLCYVTTVPQEITKTVRPDQNHQSALWFTRETVETIPDREKHPYPIHTFLKALETTPYP